MVKKICSGNTQNTDVVMITVQVKENLEIWKLTGAKKEDIIQQKFGYVSGAVYTNTQFSENTHVFMRFGSLQLHKAGAFLETAQTKTALLGKTLLVNADIFETTGLPNFVWTPNQSILEALMSGLNPASCPATSTAAR